MTIYRQGGKYIQTEDGARVRNTDAAIAAIYRARTPVISRFQGRMALRRRGLFNEAATRATMAGGDTLHAWNEAIEWRRDSPVISALGASIGLSPAQIDDLFYHAATIAV